MKSSSNPADASRVFAEIRKLLEGAQFGNADVDTNRLALQKLAPLTSAFDGEVACDQPTLAAVADHLNAHLPERFMRQLKSFVTAERAAFTALFADEGRGGIAWNDTRACLAFDARHSLLVRDLEEMVRTCSSSSLPSVSVRVPGTPAQLVAYLAPIWRRVKPVLEACVSDQPDMAALLASAGP